MRLVMQLSNYCQIMKTTRGPSAGEWTNSTSIRWNTVWWLTKSSAILTTTEDSPMRCAPRKKPDSKSSTLYDSVLWWRIGTENWPVVARGLGKEGTLPRGRGESSRLKELFCIMLRGWPLDCVQNSENCTPKWVSLTVCKLYLNLKN